MALMARDFGGGLSDYDNAGRQLGGKNRAASSVPHVNHSTATTCNCVRRRRTPNWVRPTGPPDTIIDYYVNGDSHTLIRWNQTSNTFYGGEERRSTAVAQTGGGPLQITLTFNMCPSTGPRPSPEAAT